MHGNNVSFFSFKYQDVHVMFSHWIIMPRLVLRLQRRFQPVHLVCCVPVFSTDQGCICIGFRLLFFPQAEAQTLNSANNTGQLNTSVCLQNPLGYLALFHVTKEPNIPTINSTGLTFQVWFSFFVWVKFYLLVVKQTLSGTIPSNGSVGYVGLLLSFPNRMLQKLSNMTQLCTMQYSCLGRSSS